MAVAAPRAEPQAAALQVLKVAEDVAAAVRLPVAPEVALAVEQLLFQRDLRHGLPTASPT